MHFFSFAVNGNKMLYKTKKNMLYVYFICIVCVYVGLQLIAQFVLQDPLKVIMAVEMSVETIDKLQTQLPLWDFLLGLPESFLKATDQETIVVVAENLMGMKK